MYSKFIKKLLREELDGINMGGLIKNMSLPKKLNLSSEEIAKIKAIDWKDIDFKDVGNDGRSMIFMDVILPFETTATDGIVLKIEIINGIIFQPHIDLESSLQGLGLGYKIYRSFINLYGNLYSSNAKVHNPIIYKIYDKLSLDPEIESYDTSTYRLRILKTNAKKQEIIDILSDEV